MRLLILSDLHREVWRKHAPAIDPANAAADVVILAGDIDVDARAVAWADTLFAGLPVLYVHGNHEGYGHNLDHVKSHISAACAASGHVYFLNCSEHQIGNVRFLGATLWTDFELFGAKHKHEVIAQIANTMNDYHCIRLARAGYRKLRPADTLGWHRTQRRWLEQRLATPFAGRTVVITHMAPSLQSVDDRYRCDLVSAAYASQLDALVANADIWIHGHMHSSLDYRVGNCRVVCNPCGYMKPSGAPENPDFDPGFVVELDA
ncbi:MAG: metallophosphoesterase [Betaproteobacteria bacterium HGW-Betaproteobacteria-18]|jgi:predicted phosphodiesterase|nr:MAG: metallophosphoesterase [Betaproteobacteria bacterium HGW-Betaproteobacteria-18]